MRRVVQRPDPPGYGFGTTSAQLDVFIVGPDGAIARAWKASGVDGGAWNESPALDVGTFVPGGGIAAVSKTPDSVEVFTVAMDGAVWTAGGLIGTIDGGHAVPAIPIGPRGSFKAGAGIAAVSCLPTSVDTFAIDEGGQLWDSGWRAEGINTNEWNAAYRVQAADWTSNTWVPGGGIAAASLVAGAFDTFTIGQEGALWDAGWFDGAAWHPPYRISPPGLFAPGAPLDASATRGIHIWTVNEEGVLWIAASYAVGSKSPGYATRWVAGGPLDGSAGLEWPAGAGVAGDEDLLLLVGADGALYDRTAQ